MGRGILYFFNKCFILRFDILYCFKPRQASIKFSIYTYTYMCERTVLTEYVVSHVYWYICLKIMLSLGWLVDVSVTADGIKPLIFWMFIFIFHGHTRRTHITYAWTQSTYWILHSDVNACSLLLNTILSFFR